MSRRGFTLLEIMVALGVFAVGASAAFALLVAGASAGRRAEHETNAALIAEGELADLAADLLHDVDPTELPRADPQDPNAPAPAGTNAETRWVFQDKRSPAWPDYRYDVALTPLPCPAPDETWAWLVEVEVRWTERGKGKSRQFQTVLLRGLSHRDNPLPTPPGR